MLRELVLKINRTLTERRVARRKKFSVPIKVCFAAEKNSLNLTPSCDELFLAGETMDVSETGIGFIVSAIRIKEKYLVGQQRTLNVELDIGGKKVRMQVTGVRYEKVGIHISTEKYLVGAEIISISADDKRRYDYFLRNGNKASVGATASFELGLD